MDIPTNIRYDVGEQASSTDKCYTNRVADGFCQGMKLDEVCDASLAKKCDGGLYCNAGRCAAMKKSGEECAGVNCESNLLCYPDGKCASWYRKTAGEEATNPLFCETGVVFEGKCSKYVTVTGAEWIDDATDPVNKCTYDNEKKLSATCISFSADQKAAGHCQRKDEVSMGISKIKAYLNKYEANMCPVANPMCAKAWTKIGACVYQELAKANAANILMEEDKYPECLDKAVHKAIDAIPCSAASIILSLLSLFALLLLI